MPNNLMSLDSIRVTTLIEQENYRVLVMVDKFNEIFFEFSHWLTDFEAQSH